MKTPTFNGQAVLGDPSALTASAITGSPPSVIDAFLGLSPGTTVYGAPVGGGGLVGITGVFHGTSRPALNAAYERLTALAGIRAPFEVPGGVSGTGGREFYPLCYFGPGDIVPGTPTGAGSAYQLPFALVLRVPPGS
jgi:hypothetical protein